MATRTNYFGDDGVIRKVTDFVLQGTKYALTGSRVYYAWLGALSLILLIGAYTFLMKMQHGLIITSARHLSPWGTLIYSQFPFFVGVAAGTAILVAPARIANREDFEPIVPLAQSLGVAAVIGSIGSVLVMLGKLDRLFYIFPFVGTPNFPQSMLPWDVIALNGFLILNLVLPFYVLYKAYYRERPHPWRRYLVYMSIVWGVSLNAVEGFIVVANAVRHLWYTALMLPRFLTSAFAVVPAMMILVLLTVRRVNGGWIPGLAVEDRTFHTLANIILITLAANLFSVIGELYTLWWPQTDHWATMEYLLFGFEHHGEVYSMLTPLMWFALIAEVAAILLLLHPKTRYNLKTLTLASIATFLAVFIEKGIILFVAVFIISPLGQVYEPNFTVPEVVLTVSLWAFGALIFTLLAKAAIGFRAEVFARRQ